MLPISNPYLIGEAKPAAFHETVEKQQLDNGSVSHGSSLHHLSVKESLSLQSLHIANAGRPVFNALQHTLAETLTLCVTTSFKITRISPRYM